MFLPGLFRLRQTFDRPRVDDIAGEVRRQMEHLDLSRRVQTGQSVAITVGSRGIRNMREIIAASVVVLQEAGAAPFLVPAMGSHGGGTATGQLNVLKSYGITEEYCRCPIRASMETVVVCRANEGFDVHFDRHAYEADHVLVCNRVKPHTNFVGSFESGLMKMMLIGLGKKNGAYIYHRAIQDYTFEQIVRSVGECVLDQCNILGGLAIVENAYDETARLEAVLPEEFAPREQQLLVQARQWMPRLPFGDVDVLVIDEIGKQISGTGMDTNVIGRKPAEELPGQELPRVKNVVVLRLRPDSYGNACGIGRADFTTERVVDAMDRQVTWINCLTGADIESAKTPVHLPTDRATIEAALVQIGLVEPADARVIWIENTLLLENVACSATYQDEAQQRSDLEILSSPRPFPFDDEGNLAGVREFEN
tara:strand:- start:658 stop:1926 length:1269 start_codon:yes stop_codon:yes gene_type:complete